MALRIHGFWAKAGAGIALLVFGLAGGRLGQAAEEAKASRTLEEALQRGIEFLLETQNKNGSWGSAKLTKDLNIYAPAPGAHHAFRCGVTALDVMALIETGAAAKDQRVEKAIERGEAWLLDNLPNLRRADTDAIYNVWGHGYGIQALVRMYHRLPEEASRRERIKEEILNQVDLLNRYESVDGGWGYYDFKVGSKKPASFSTSFVTATILVAFHEAKSVGIDVPDKLVQRGVKSIQLQRKKDNTYAYSLDHRMSPMRGINRPGGSLGRSQACNYALHLWGDDTIDTKVFVTWLDRLIARNDWLGIGRKRPVPHESWFQVAGYFFYYGHYYAVRCIEELPEDRRAKYKEALAKILIPLQEKDGSWWDFPLYDYHRPYGTGFALMSLVGCRP